MAYGEGSKSSMIGIGAIVGLIVFGVLIWRAVIVFTALTAPSLEKVEKQLFSAPDTGIVYQTLKRTYPQEYDTLTHDILRRLEAGEPTALVDEAIATELMQIQKRHRRDAIQAPHDKFAAYRRAEIAVVQSLRDTDLQLCDSYVMTGTVRTMPWQSQASRGPLIAQRVAMLEAGAAGRDHPAGRKVDKPSADDARALGALMKSHGASEADVNAFFSPGGLSQLSGQDQCITGLAFFQGVDQLPGEKADQFYGYLISSDL